MIYFVCDVAWLLRYFIDFVSMVYFFFFGFVLTMRSQRASVIILTYDTTNMVICLFDSNDFICIAHSCGFSTTRYSYLSVRDLTLRFFFCNRFISSY